MSITGIETSYAGCRFRSRLEARWAVFFDHAGIPWEYEPQGFDLDGTWYLPDFLLPECGTWVEVKGNEAKLDKPALHRAAPLLPLAHNGRGEIGPPLMVVGPIPAPPSVGDLGWVSFPVEPECGEGWRYGFGGYGKNRRPWALCMNVEPNSVWLTPDIDEDEPGYANDAYVRARSARFEHSERG